MFVLGALKNRDVFQQPTGIMSKANEVSFAQSYSRRPQDEYFMRVTADLN
jgi:hypothetical protein